MTLVVAAENFARGYVGDVARDQLPANAAYRMKDWIPGLDARLRGRGGWVYTSPDLSTVHAGPTKLVAVGWVPSTGGIASAVVAVGDDGSVYWDSTLDGVTALYAGAGPAGMTAPPFWNKLLGNNGRGGLVLLPPASNPAAGVFKYADYTIGLPDIARVDPLAGTPPLGTVGASWEEYLLLANGWIYTGNPPPNTYSKYPNRIWVSGVGAPESWTPGTDFWDSSIPQIVGLVPLHAGIAVFGTDNTNLISGDTPPAGGNWSEETAFHGVGCFDVRSIAVWSERAIFANNKGVYMTDGVSLTDLTLQAGIKNRWRQLVGSFRSSYWTAAGGVYQNYYVISIHDASGNFVTCQVFDLEHGTVFEFTNIQAVMFASTPQSLTTSPDERLFMASASSKKVQELHTAWSAPDNLIDGDGTLVLPQLETPFYKVGGAGKKVYRAMRATYDARSQGGSTPSLAVDYCTTPGGSYTNAGSLPTTTDESRVRVPIAARGTGIGLRLTQTAQSSHTTLSEIELDLSVLEGMR